MFKFRDLRAGLIAAALAGMTLSCAAEAAKPAGPAMPTSVELLFDRKHLANVDVGTDLIYRFQRTVSSTDVLGQPYSDDIAIQIKKVLPNGTRELVVKVFTGERARDPQPFDDLTNNPILIVFLDRSIASYMSVAGGKVPYLKDKFRTALRERATVEPVKVKLADKVVDGHRVTVTPYAGDLNASKMRGYENARFAFVVSDEVPGHFVEMLAIYENNAKDAPRLEERTLKAGTEVLK